MLDDYFQLTSQTYTNKEAHTLKISSVWNFANVQLRYAACVETSDFLIRFSNISLKLCFQKVYFST